MSYIVLLCAERNMSSTTYNIIPIALRLLLHCHWSALAQNVPLLKSMAVKSHGRHNLILDRLDRQNDWHLLLKVKTRKTV